MKIQKSRKLVAVIAAAMTAGLAAPAFAEDPAPPPAAEVPNETAPVAPMDNGGMGSAEAPPPAEAPAEAPAPRKHHAKKKAPKKSKKKKKSSKSSKHSSKKKKKKKHHHSVYSS